MGEKRTTLDMRIRDNAHGVNLPESLSGDVKERHIDICQRLVGIADENEKFPMGVLVYIAVGKDAHKTATFERGYNRFNEEKARTILKWARIFADHSRNNRLFRNSDVIHALVRYYDTNSQNTEEFRKLVDASEHVFHVINFTQIARILGVEKK